MDIEIFTLCDFAEDIMGKQVIVGTFDQIFANQMPAIHPICTAAAKIRFSQSESRTHNIGIQIISPDGKEITPLIGGPIPIQVPPGFETACANFQANLQGLKFEAFGKYSVVLSIDGQKLRTVPLTIARPPQPQING